MRVIIALGALGLGAFLAILIYLFVVKIPGEHAYCSSMGYDRIDIDRSWACINPQTRALYR